MNYTVTLSLISGSWLSDLITLQYVCSAQYVLKATNTSILKLLCHRRVNSER